MPAEIAFDKSFAVPPNQVDHVLPGVRRIVCDNPSPFTFTGTVTYIVGTGKVAIIDPGPLDAPHAAAILDAVRNETVTHILVTHTHRDHSPGVAAIKAATGATVYAEGPHRAARPLFVGEAPRTEAGGDTDFRPDIRLADGEVVTGDGWALETIATPGHTANHVGFALRGTDVLFSGDHVMAWATSIVAPPDGSMRDYMNSLFKLRARPENLYLPGHGGAVRDAHAHVEHFIQHREAREAAILRRLERGRADIPTLVRGIYIGLDPRLTRAAGMSTLAHLEDLVARDVVKTEGAPSIEGTYWLEG
jgi:glyoxylase-like metal-dependent hydrolase (beta-lactamase superfamily II)